ncbi:MAG: YceD family protein [Wenzhouxiangellaceae bacterium]|nr:YceD family protein [Wenzhouxiangellaceae bacterium]
MSRDFPDWIDVERAAQGGRRFAGEIPLLWLERVVDLLTAPEPDEVIGFEVEVSANKQGTLLVDVHVFGAVPMTCQRTLKRFWQPIDSHSTLAIVKSERELDELPEDLEPKLVADGRVKLAELVEDELLLALPLVPKDPASEPVINAGDVLVEVDQAQKNPFAALAGMRGGQSEQDDEN